MNTLRPWTNEYKTSHIAASIASGHGYQKHGNDFNHIGVHTKLQFATHINNTLKDKSTIGFRGYDKTDFFYNSKTNTYICVNLGTRDGSTCFAPPEKSGRFNAKFEKEISECKNYGFKEPKIIIGGYSILKKHHREIKKLLIQKRNVTKNDILKRPKKSPPKPTKGFKKAKDLQRRKIARLEKAKRMVLQSEKLKRINEAKKQADHNKRLVALIKKKNAEHVKAQQQKLIVQHKVQKQQEKQQPKKDQFAELAQKMLLEKANRQKQMDMEKQKQKQKEKEKEKPKLIPQKDQFAELAEKMRLEKQERLRREKEMEMRQNFGKKF